MVMLQQFFRLLGILLLVGASTSFAEPIQHSDYRLNVGDKLKITVLGHEELSGEFFVGDKGEVTLPLVQRVDSLGLTTDQLATAIAARLRPDYLANPVVVVELLSFRPFYILGEVRNPGSYPFIEGMTALNAIAVAGGYEPRANRDFVLIDRNTRDKPIKASLRSTIRPGDVITIKERFF